MAKYSSSFTTNNSSTSAVLYRAGMGVNSAALNAVLPRTTDTGQVNFATVASGPTLAANRDYEVFRFDDALQATKPIVIRFQWGYDGINAAIGTATNGAGTINAGTSIGLPAGSIWTALSAGNTRYVYASSDGSYLAFITNCQPVSAANADTTVGFVVERTRDGDGTPNGDGIMIYKWQLANLTGDQTGAANTVSFQAVMGRIYDTAATQPPQTFDFAATAPNAAAVTNWSNAVGAYAFPVFGAVGNTLYGASKAIMLGGINEFTRLAPYTITNYGSPQNWVSLGVGSPVYMAHNSAATTQGAKQYSVLIRQD